LWQSGLAVETHDSAEYRVRDGQLERTRKQLQVRGLSHNRNPHLKQLFKSTVQRKYRAEGRNPTAPATEARRNNRIMREKATPKDSRVGYTFPIWEQ